VSEEEINDYLAASGTPDPTGSGGRTGEVLTAVAMVGAEIGELRAHLGDALKNMTALRGDVTKLGQATAGITRLTAEVHELAAHVDQLAGDEDTKTPKPVDLAHLDDDNRADVLGELANWVHTVLFTGWPQAAEQIRACWPHHPDLINDLLLLKTAYEAAYQTGSRRAHHAVEFRHLLDYITAGADERARNCPTDLNRHEVSLPARNDLGAMNTAARDMVLAKVWRLTEQVNHARQLGRTDLAEQAGKAAEAMVDDNQITPAEYQAYEKRVRDTHAAARTRKAQRARADKDD
jgi:outer membrane murein-binding lipoprotein Lpp